MLRFRFGAAGHLFLVFMSSLALHAASTQLTLNIHTYMHTCIHMYICTYVKMYMPFRALPLKFSLLMRFVRACVRVSFELRFFIYIYENGFTGAFLQPSSSASCCCSVAVIFVATSKWKVYVHRLSPLVGFSSHTAAVCICSTASSFSSELFACK